MATDAQVQYLEKLFIDCGFATRLQRNDYIKSEILRFSAVPVERIFLDELKIHEASTLIDKLKELKDEVGEREYNKRSWKDGSD